MIIYKDVLCQRAKKEKEVNGYTSKKKIHEKFLVLFITKNKIHIKKITRGEARREHAQFLEKDEIFPSLC